jgi:hypothetical protein
MSQVVVVECKITDLKAIKEAVKRCQASFVNAKGQTVSEPISEKHHLYSENVQGIGIKLDGWRYPAVVTADGNLSFDNYRGAWGKLERLQAFQQAYAVESVLERARSSCRFVQVQENQLENGCIELLCTEY